LGPNQDTSLNQEYSHFDQQSPNFALILRPAVIVGDENSEYGQIFDIKLETRIAYLSIWDWDLTTWHTKQEEKRFLYPSMSH